MGGKQRINTIPTIIHNEEVVVSDSRKAEILAQTFVKVHSNENISNDMMKLREQSMRKNPHVLEVKESTADALDYELTLYELKRAIAGTKQTFPGRDEICYEMFKHLSDSSLNAILRFYNKVWNSGKLPMEWKHGVIIPVAKPGKDHMQSSNYRPIALTSNVCKIMERMVMNRLVYVIEKRDIFSPFQSGFRKGRNTMYFVL